MSTSRADTLVDLFQELGVVVTHPDSTRRPIEKLQDLADQVIKTLVKRGDLDPVSLADIKGRVDDILASRGMAPDAIRRWWDTPLIGLGMRVPLMMIHQDLDRVVAIAREVNLPTTRKASRERLDAQRKAEAQKHDQLVRASARSAQAQQDAIANAASYADSVRKASLAAAPRPRPSE